MPTVPDRSDRRDHRPPGPGPRRPRVLDARTLAWPVGLLLLLVAIGTWRADDGTAGGDLRREAPGAAVRSFGDLELDVPASWRTLDRTEGHVTWGSTDRAHLVTLASTEAAPEPLLAVVRELTREVPESIPGARVVAGPRLVDHAELRRGDSAVLVELEVDGAGDGSPPLRLVQAWRRDARAGVDVVATWTSRDDTWPADPRSNLPRVGDGAAR